jgi:hypothetical protein
MNHRQMEIEEARRRTCEITGDQEIQYHTHGNEGVIFTNGGFAYKYFFAGKSALEAWQLDMIKEQLLNREHVSFVHLDKIYENDDELVFRMEFFDGSSYQGGHLDSFRRILIECRDKNIAYRNIHPKNLLVRDGVMKICDIGRSVYPMTSSEYLEMAKRSYLTYRWHFRKDLSELMTQSLNNESLPELTGFEYFWRSLDVKPVRGSLTELITQLMKDATDLKVLDGICDEIPDLNYACKGRDVFDRVFFDLDRVSERDEGEVRAILKNIHRSTRPRGKVLLAISNPFDVNVRETETHLKEFPDRDRANQNQTFFYVKRPKVDGEAQKIAHRPYERLERILLQCGLVITALYETSETDFDRLSPASDYLVLEARPITMSPKRNVSLLIKASPVEWETIDFQIKHIVKQLDTPAQFLEIVVVTDEHEGPFLRQYARPDHKVLKEKLQRLQDEGWIDRIVYAPLDETAIKRTYTRWFGLETKETHAENGQHTYTTLYGIDKCTGDYILQMDSDCIIVRKDLDHDPIGEMIECLNRDPEAISVSFKVAGNKSENFSRKGDGSEWRIEVRCSMFKKDRLFNVLPLSNSLNSEGIMVLPWHRALDEIGGHVYRGGDDRAFFIHVPNQMKVDINFWYNVVKQCESGSIPIAQIGNVDLQGSLQEWYPSRNEQFIFIIRGKNVDVRKVRRMLRSIDHQKNDSWGIVFIDADSDNGSEDYLEKVVMPQYARKTSFWRNWTALTPIENTKIAISSLCNDPESIMITLDMDDSLIGQDVIDTLNTHYDSGADVTIGSMLRTDKYKEYPVDLVNPRGSRGGNVWQHLRTFKKYLFDTIPEDYFKINGEWIPHTEDWAFMLPIIDMANNPLHIIKKLYFYEPSPHKNKRDNTEKERIIGNLINKNKLNKSHSLPHK